MRMAGFQSTVERRFGERRLSRRFRILLKGLSILLFVCLASAAVWASYWVPVLHHQGPQAPPPRQVKDLRFVSKNNDYQCDLMPYGLTIEHLPTSSSDLVTINPDSPRAPRFSFKASSTTTPSPEAIASHIQVIRRRNCNSTTCAENKDEDEDEDEDHEDDDDTNVEIVWDSGWIRAGRRNGLDITTSSSNDRQLDGLVPMERLFWRARFGIANGDNHDEDSSTAGSVIAGCPWSEYEQFLVGPSKTQWETADWICAPSKVQTDCDFYDTTGRASAPLFRTEFDLVHDGKNNVATSARLFVTGLGHYEAWMNGIHINRDRYLDPAPSSYDKRIYYNSFDVTDAIVVRSNKHAAGSPRRQALGFVVGNGWFNPLPMKLWGQRNLRKAMTVGVPRVRCILVVEYSDENLQPLIIVSSTSTSTFGSNSGTEWMTTDSGLLRNDLYLGNVMDLDRAKWLRGWSKVGFNSPLIKWQPVVACPPPTSQQQGLVPILEPQPIPPIRSRPPHQLKAISTITIGNDLVLDMGFNTAAAVHVEIFVPDDWVCSAQQIELRFGEILFSNGTVNGYTSVAGQIKEGGCCGPCAPEVAYQQMILKTTQTSQHTTQFSWSAFRYVQISSLPPGWQINVTAIPLMTDLKWTSSFKSSNSRLDDIYELCRNTHASNMMGIQSDCPHRERFGYTGDTLATLPTSLAFFDGTAFYEKRLYDVQDSLRVNGGVTETAPFVGIASNGFGEGSGPIGWQSFFPMVQLELRRYYGNTRALSDMQNDTRRWMQLVLNHTLEVENGLGDWMATDKVCTAISGRVFLIEALRAWASLVDSEDEKAVVLKRVHQELSSFDTRFISADTGDVVVNGSQPTQSGQAMTLHYNLVPAGRRHLVSQGLVRAMERSQHHITTGMFGVLPLFESLSAINRSDIAWDIVMQTTYPSFGYMLENNATTLWESWFFSNSTFSHNHPMFSGVASWMIEHFGGIRLAKDAIGSDRLIFAPNPPAMSGLRFANITLETARGKAICHWECQMDGTMIIQIECPVNTRGILLLPDGSAPLHIRGGVYRYQVSATPCQLTSSIT